MAWVRHPSLLTWTWLRAWRLKRRVEQTNFVDDAADAALQVVEVIRRRRGRRLAVTFVVSDRANKWATATRLNCLTPMRMF